MGADSRPAVPNVTEGVDNQNLRDFVDGEMGARRP